MVVRNISSITVQYIFIYTTVSFHFPYSTFNIKHIVKLHSQMAVVNVSIVMQICLIYHLIKFENWEVASIYLHLYLIHKNITNCFMWNARHDLQRLQSSLCFRIEDDTFHFIPFWYHIVMGYLITCESNWIRNMLSVS